MSTIHKRIEQLVTAKGTNLYQISKDLGHKRPDKFYSIVNGKAKPSFDTIEEILNLYPDVNANWLFKGQGEMLINDDAKEQEQLKLLNSKESKFDFNKLGIIDTQVVVAVVDGQDNPNIPLVDTKAAAGYVHHYTEPEYFRKLPAFTLPGPQFRNGTFCCFQIHGESMTETLFPGDWVITRFADNWVNTVRDGFIYVVVTSETVLVKRILNRVTEGGKIVLLSDNPVYPTQEINAQEIRQLWHVQARLSFQLGNVPARPYDKISTLEADMHEVKERLSVLELKADEGLNKVLPKRQTA